MRYLFLLLLTGCAAHLTSVSLVDPNGFQQTITSRERLSRFEKTDFRSSQPYQKVLCVYDQGPSIITSYHSNGALHQRLEVSDGRAFGHYEEFFSDGSPKLSATVVGGAPDLDAESLHSLIFEGVSRVWDPSGYLYATIPYSCGELDGVSTYYFPSAQPKETITYRSGLRDGESRGYSSPGDLAYVEYYSKDLLIEGDYLTSQIREGCGVRTIPGCQTTYVDGVPHGEVREAHRSYFIFHGVKDGEERTFFPDGSLKMLVTWRAGEMQGPVKTWYPSGQLENQREMSCNRRMGTSFAWYADGSLMLIEEYLDDQLVRGEYFARGNPTPLSQIEGGTGLAILFDSEGNLLRRVSYVDGLPLT